MIKVFFKKLDSNASIPSFAHNDNTNAAVDFSACLDFSVTIKPGEFAHIPTGIAWYVDPSSIKKGKKLAMIIQSRSGMVFKNGVECSNAGVIDQGYTGEIKLCIYNTNKKHILFRWLDKNVTINNGDRIAQGIIEELPLVEVSEWDMNTPLPETVRGGKGFGSSGMR